MLRTRLFLNLLPFVVILLAVGIYAIVLFSRLANSVDATVTDNYRSILAAQSMSLALGGMEREGWLAAGGQTNDNQVFAQHQQRFEENLSLLLKREDLSAEKKLNQQLVTNYNAFKAATAGLDSSVKAGAQYLIYQQEIVPVVFRMNLLLENIRDANQKAFLLTSQKIQKITGDVTRLMIIGMIIALLISAYACYQLSRSILQPILSLTQATRELGEGSLGQPVPVTARDELGELAVAFNKMAAQLQEYRQSTTEKIVRLHRTMETTLASFPDPIFVLNKDGLIELKNPAADDLGANLYVGTQLRPPLQALARKTLETGESFLPHSFNEVVSCRLNRAQKFFLPRILAMRDKEDALFGVAVVLYDVTRFRLLDAAKTNLVATVSHELKSPLTNVRMTLHILLEKIVGALTQEQDELLQAARNDTERLLRILNDLLDLARLEEGNAELHKEDAQAADLLQSVMKEMADEASARGLTMICDIEPDLPALPVDRQRISHVFTNLVANAIKHSPPRSEILVRAARAGDSSVQFSITDHGPGIAEEYQARIFDRFFRVPGQTKTGAGLGLSIAREITVAHGGRIGVKSSLGQGSTFYVVLKGINATPG
jgi:NtrC-family two-component system sensor histidine kinase KinB